jgi:branched-chain amino acid transport system permease protein
MTATIQGLIQGTLIGGMYAAVAVGLTLVFGVVRIVNFAHGAFVMAGGYCAWLLYDHLQLSPYVSVFIVAVGFFVVGVLYYAIFIRLLVGKPLFAQAIFTIAVTIVMENGALAIFGPDPHVVTGSYTTTAYQVGAFSFQLTRLIAFGAGLAATLLLYLVLWRTDVGTRVRASAADLTTAQLMGINTFSVQSIATGLGIACAGIGGVILLPLLNVSPSVGDQFTLLSFLIIVLGGLGSFFGALVGGILIGCTETLGATYFNGSLAHMLTFVIFVLLLLLRPQGLLRRRAL